MHILIIQSYYYSKSKKVISYYTERILKEMTHPGSHSKSLASQHQKYPQRNCVQRWTASVILSSSLTQNNPFQVKSSGSGWLMTTLVKQRTCFIVFVIHMLTSNPPKDMIWLAKFWLWNRIKGCVHGSVSFCLSTSILGHDLSLHFHHWTKENSPCSKMPSRYCL